MGREEPFLTCDEEVHSIVFDTERAEPVCSKCGLVLDDMKFDFLIESHAVPRRKPVKSRSDHRLKRSLKHRSLERKLLEILLEKKTGKDVQDKAFELYCLIRKKQLHVGYSVSTLCRTLIYVACRLCQVPVTFAECAGLSVAERKRVARCYEKLRGKLELNVPRFKTADYLSELAKKMTIDDETVTIASEILVLVKEKRLGNGANPVGIVAAATYIAGCLTGNKTTQKRLSKAANVSEVTIRANCRTLRNLVEALQTTKR